LVEKHHPPALPGIFGDADITMAFFHPVHRPIQGAADVRVPVVVLPKDRVPPGPSARLVELCQYDVLLSHGHHVRWNKVGRVILDDDHAHRPAGNVQEGAAVMMRVIEMRAA
jgi:hypothetical protein